jgi:hypothetical protein
MVSVDRAWARQSHRFPGKRLQDFRLQVITSQYSIAPGATAVNQPVNFAASAVILGILAAAAPTGQTALQTYRPGLDLFSTTITYQADNRYVSGTAEVLGSALFGNFGNEFPALELWMPQNSALVYNFTSLVSRRRSC